MIVMVFQACCRQGNERSLDGSHHHSNLRAQSRLLGAWQHKVEVKTQTQRGT